VSSAAPQPLALRDRLIAFLESEENELNEQLTGTTSLIKSGALDSLGVFNLATWIERELNCEIDPMTFDLASEWDTVDQIVGFVSRRSDPVSDHAPARTAHYEIVPYSSAFKWRVAELQRHLWSSNPSRNRDYLEWKYERNPYLQPSLIFLALSGSEVVAMRGVLGSRWEVGSPTRSVVLPYAADLVARPDHRNTGLITSILKSPFKELRARNHRYVINLSASQMTLALSLGLGWHSAGDVRLVVRRRRAWLREHRAYRIVRHTPLLWRFATTIAPLASGLRGRPFRALDSNPAHRRRFSPVTITQAPRPEAMGDLVRRLGHDGRLRHVRDAEYFNWRFQNPLAAYRFLFHGGNQLDGYLVLEASTSDLHDRNTVTIVDWEGADDTVRAQLLDAALSGGDFVAVNCWSGTLPASSRDCLAKAGFVAPEGTERNELRRPAVLLKSVREDEAPANWAIQGAPLLDLSSWDLRALAGML